MDIEIVAFNLLHLPNNCSNTDLHKCVSKQGSVCCFFYSKATLKNQPKLPAMKSRQDSRINGVLYGVLLGHFLEYFWSSFWANLEYFWSTLHLHGTLLLKNGMTRNQLKPPETLQHHFGSFVELSSRNLGMGSFIF